VPIGYEAFFINRLAISQVQLMYFYNTKTHNKLHHSGGQPQKSSTHGKTDWPNLRMVTRYHALYPWLSQYIASAVPTNGIPCVYIYVSTQYNPSGGGKNRIPVIPVHRDNRPIHIPDQNS
jgi:hypothetical protein